MRTHIYKVVIEVEDLSESDGEDIEEQFEYILEYLPNDLKAHVLEVTEADDEDY